jgi:hypothetical protein
MVKHRPIPVTGLRLENYKAPMEQPPIAYPYGLANVASKYARCVPHLFMDHAELDHVSDLYLLDLPDFDHLTPVVNMAQIKPIHGDSLSTIPEESTRSSTGSVTDSTRTLVHTMTTYEGFLEFSPGFDGAIFNIS